LKCKTCDKNADSEYCFQHKPRKPLVQSRLNKSAFSAGNVKKISEMQEFFLNIWKKRPHRCENCDAHLGSEPLSYMFDHVLEKSKYPDLRHEEENICILCLDCHSNKTNCKLSDFMKEKIKKVKEIFGK